MGAMSEDCIRIGVDGFAAAVLPAIGGKIASIQIDGRELLQAPLTDSMARSRAMAFDAGDASGWDECLPSVAACEVKTAAGTAAIPDHGDLWRAPWEATEITSNACTMRARCFSLPLELERTLTVERIDTGYQLSLDYNLCNIGSAAAPWAWSAHPLFAIDAGDRILLPESIQSVRVEGSTGGRLGKAGAVVGWPIANTSAGDRTDLSVAQAADSGLGDKLFAGPLAETENWCAVERRSAGVRIRVSFDPAATPFLGLWLCYGGWPARPGPKQMCVALEPATEPVDSLVRAGQWQRMLDPGASAAWSMAAEFQRI